MNLYEIAGHRIQTAIGFLMGANPRYKPTEPKHMRTGIDLSKADMAGLADLLISKGVFTEAEYVAAITASAGVEADRYERELSDVLGRPVTTL